jgi:hypothetical protein
VVQEQYTIKKGFAFAWYVESGRERKGELSSLGAGRERKGELSSLGAFGVGPVVWLLRLEINLWRVVEREKKVS